MGRSPCHRPRRIATGLEDLHERAAPTGGGDEEVCHGSAWCPLNSWPSSRAPSGLMPDSTDARRRRCWTKYREDRPARLRRVDVFDVKLESSPPSDSSNCVPRPARVR